MGNTILTLKEQLTIIDNQIFALADKYEWKSLDNAIRGWVSLSGHEKDQDAYQKRKIIYQD